MSFLPGSQKHALLLEPYDYICSNPGKSFRTKLTEAFNLWLKIPDEKLQVISKIMEMLHNASLLIDDVQDNSELRRGNPVAHRIYGVPITINCANYVYFLALEEVIKLGNPRLVQIFSEELRNLHRGQGMDLHWRERNVCPTQQEYLDMISNKTGGLLRLGIKMMQVLGDEASDFIPLVDIVGQLYQIHDDYINLKETEYHNLKGFCEDITEGKYSFPVIHSLRNSSNPNQLQYILKQKTEDVEIKKHAVRLMHASGSFEYTRQHLVLLSRQAREELKRVGGNPLMEKLLNRLDGDIVSKSG
ncbi:geranylgeranyl pyrophosphate synthetase [Entomophthora muscae]|uniref:Geranylgeranyl pyrophosphate synthetase n=1 Tax=Entomophthora muscae TaxID=34485 RepID=A0ACC2USP3_9FUNG|nr:geranylgeranyl pyrophosphate synthetase [Entomophthora muscae]